MRIYSLTSIDAAAREATREALRALGTVALGGFVLAAFGSLWLARRLTDPIKRVAGDIATMTAARDFGRTLEVAGTSRELDALATAFNELMSGLTAAEAETQSAYLGAIRALAAALDARDPYTAGHSERVSALSVLIARQLSLSEAEVDIIRLGALLHDIGKIGVADHILRKPGALSADEFEQIGRHPDLARASCARCRSSSLTWRSSNSITSGPTARGIPSAFSATTSRSTRASCTWPTPSTR